VVSLEAARLARNGRDWHTPLEFCGLVGMLIVNEEAIYEHTSQCTYSTARWSIGTDNDY
jgi:hypothetical protein